MRFRWRRHAAETVAPVVHEPRLTDEQVLEIVESRLSEHFGPRGSWSLVPRGASDTDTLFQEFLTHSIAVELTTAIAEQSASLTQAAALTQATATPVSPEWQPEPIAVWAETEDQMFRPDPADLTGLVASMTPAVENIPVTGTRHVA